MEWNNQQQQQQSLLQPTDNGGGGGGGGGGIGGDGGGICQVKVMTDEQLELLRKQISAYATICDQLVEMHKSVSAQQDLSGMKLGSLYCDPLVTVAGHKITTRHRWTATPTQLQILENMFKQGIGTPNKEKVTEITMELAQHGPVTEQSVYTWFQNRRARSKRKQTKTQNNGDAEAEAEVESLKEKKTKAKSVSPLERATSSSDIENVYFQDNELSAEMHGLYEDSPRANRLASEMEPSRSSSPYPHRDGYDIIE